METKKRIYLLLISAFSSTLFLFLIGVGFNMQGSGNRIGDAIAAIGFIVFLLLFSIIYKTLESVMEPTREEKVTTSAAKRKTKDLKREKEIMEAMKDKERKRQEEWEKLQQQYKG